jgi:predicted dehydrogenase
MKNIALIGVGKMGLSHLAIANQTPGIEVKAICDTSLESGSLECDDFRASDTMGKLLSSRSVL